MKTMPVVMGGGALGAAGLYVGTRELAQRLHPAASAAQDQVDRDFQTARAAARSYVDTMEQSLGFDVEASSHSGAQSAQMEAYLKEHSQAGTGGLVRAEYDRYTSGIHDDPAVGVGPPRSVSISNDKPDAYNAGTIGILKALGGTLPVTGAGLALAARKLNTPKGPHAFVEVVEVTPSGVRNLPPVAAEPRVAPPGAVRNTRLAGLGMAAAGAAILAGTIHGTS